MMKKIVKRILRLSAKIAVKRNKYKVVAITGSVGKTSTKKAVILVLEERYRVLYSDEGYNTEFGLPLTLLQRKIPASKAKWILLVLSSPILALQKKKYDFCVVEMGADKPGDIEYLTDIIEPNIAIVTSVAMVHLAPGQFTDLGGIAKEKEKILAGLKKGDVAILNVDNEYVSGMKVPDHVKKLTFGKKASDIKIIGQDIDKGGSLNKFEVRSKDIKIKSKAIGEHVLYVFASAIAVGISQGVNLKDITRALESFESVKGRLNIIKGINHSMIIDDSYNANPTSMKNALDVLDEFRAKRKIAALGNMNELGKYSREAHEEIGRYLSKKCDMLVTVGSDAEKYIVKGALGAGMKKEAIYSFNTSDEAGDFLKKNVKEGDITLAKGSQNKVRMEKAVRKIMANPDRAQEMLCRQGKEWERKE